jgi:RecA/RadA recombinase
MARPPSINKSEQTGDNAKKILKEILGKNTDHHYNHVEAVPEVRIPSGSMLLDNEVSLKTGNVLRMVGPTESGKTSQACLYAKNFMEIIPNSRTLYVKAEGRLGTDIRTRTGLKFVFNAEEWEDGTVFVLESNIFEFIANTIESLLKSLHDQGKQLCVIVDSMDGLMLQADYHQKAIGENQKVAGVPLITKLLFKRLALPINKYGALVFLTSQVSANIKIDQYSAEAPRVIGGAGGNALNHQADYILEYQPKYNGDFILEDEKIKYPDPLKNKILGVWAKVKIVKSTKETSGMTISIPIRRGRIGNAIWQEKEIGDFLLQYNLVSRKGSWITIDKSVIDQVKTLTGKEMPEQVQGINNLYEYFEQNKDVTVALAKVLAPV